MVQRQVPRSFSVAPSRGVLGALMLHSICGRQILRQRRANWAFDEEDLIRAEQNQAIAISASDLGSTSPTTVAAPPRLRKLARNWSDMLADIESSNPPAVCGSKSRVLVISSTEDPNCTTDSANSRLDFKPPGTYPARTHSTAPGSIGIFAEAIFTLTLLASAISRVCPIRPNPVMSVAAWTSGLNSAATSAASLLRVVIDLVAPATHAGSALPCLIAVEMTPVPSGLVSMSTSLAFAPLFAKIRFGCTDPVTAYPNLISSSRILWPPITVQPASIILERPPARICSAICKSSLSGKHSNAREVSGRPPMA